jgi:hypothetical protein
MDILLGGISPSGDFDYFCTIQKSIKANPLFYITNADINMALEQIKIADDYVGCRMVFFSPINLLRCIASIRGCRIYLPKFIQELRWIYRRGFSIIIAPLFTVCQLRYGNLLLIVFFTRPQELFNIFTNNCA